MKKCKNCKKQPVYCKQALYCKACSKTIARAQRRLSNHRRRMDQYKNARLEKPAAFLPKKMSWEERRERIRACVERETHKYINRLTPHQAGEMQGAAA